MKVRCERPSRGDAGLAGRARDGWVAGARGPFRVASALPIASKVVRPKLPSTVPL